MNSGTWVDGKPADAVPLTDRGLQYGDGLFETCAVQDGGIRRLGMHLDRLREGCARLDMPMPDAELRLAAQDQAQAVLKLILTRGSGGRGYRPPERTQVSRLLLRYPWPDYPAVWSEEGVELRICSTRLGRNPALAGLKHLNRLEQVLARAEWVEGAAEGLMRDEEGFIVEGTMSNVFASPAEGRLVTPDLSQAGVAGVTRRHIMERAQRQGLAVEVRRLPLEELLASREIFVCNSIVGVWPVKRIDSRDYAVGPMTRHAARWVQE